MNVKEKKVIDIEIGDTPAPAKRRLELKKAVLITFVVVVALIISTVCGFSELHKARVALADTQNAVAALEQQNQANTGELAELKAQNETLKSQNQVLKAELDAFKAQLLNYGIQYPPEAYKGKKLIALTFDDGPGQYTAELLNFFKENEVRATFFLLGTNAARRPELIKRMQAEGHAIGNHSFNHPNLTKLSAAGVASQIEKCNAAIRKAVNHNALVLRCPGGSNNATVKAAAKSANLPIIHWSLDTLDWKLQNKDKIVTRVFDEVGIKDGDIVLLHDIHRASVDATKEIVLRLKKEGYTFVTVPELLSVRKGGMTAGQVYVNALPSK